MQLPSATVSATITNGVVVIAITHHDDCPAVSLLIVPAWLFPCCQTIYRLTTSGNHCPCPLPLHLPPTAPAPTIPPTNPTLPFLPYAPSSRGGSGLQLLLLTSHPTNPTSQPNNEPAANQPTGYHPTQRPTAIQLNSLNSHQLPSPTDRAKPMVPVLWPAYFATTHLVPGTARQRRCCSATAAFDTVGPAPIPG